MSQIHNVLNNETVPSGEFGDFTPEGSALPGSIQFTNHGRVTVRVSVHGSDNEVNWTKIGKTMKAGPGRTCLKRLKTVQKFLFFHNARVASGPASLDVLSAD